jgi:hypothetical protein
MLDEPTQINPSNSGIFSDRKIFIKYSLDINAHTDSRIRWNTFRHSIIYGEDDLRDAILYRWLCYCELERNRSLSILNSIKIGIGGTYDITGKQLLIEDYDNYPHNVIMRIPNNDINPWDFDDLYDLIDAFIKLCNHYTHSHACNAEIIIKL